ncbi:hypothetical protein O59_000054 [Cellvibrio sp. BR]|nr:hypothetical protein O59_000054 [Cellvibrio sp. BR]
MSLAAKSIRIWRLLFTSDKKAEQASYMQDLIIEKPYNQRK